jgi:hypothetical protein
MHLASFGVDQASIFKYAANKITKTVDGLVFVKTNIWW